MRFATVTATALAALCLAGSVTAQSPPDAAASVAVKMTRDVQTHMGVEVVALPARDLSDVVPAYVRAVDIGPLIALDADIQSARASAASTSSEYKRLDVLAGQDQSASQQAVEAARAAAANDRARVALLERRLRYEWSPALADELNKGQSRLMDALVDGRARLVRADAPTQSGGVIGAVAIEVSREAAPVIAQPLGLSAAVDPRTQTTGLFALVRGTDAAGIRPGKAFSGTINLPEISTGVVVPRSAILRVDGETWVYVQVAADSFSRRTITDARRIADGWFVTSGVAPGDTVAVAGVESLFAAEGADETAEGE